APRKSDINAININPGFPSINTIFLYVNPRFSRIDTCLRAPLPSTGKTAGNTRPLTDVRQRVDRLLRNVNEGGGNFIFHTAK
ncbi:MAG: hypothetical protein LBH04_00360, partial [Tannerellaceae bacterium]|nr:hypothetical protein [Tannerellaceae bacterium]